MPASSRSPEPLENVKRHGATGYDLGCGCDKCKRGQAARVKRYRDRKAAGTVGTNVIKFPSHAGTFERGVMATVHDIGAEGAEAQLLIDMMLFNAKLLDSIPENGRWHLAASAQKTIRDLKDELHKLAGGKTPPDPAGNLEGFLSGLTRQEK